MRSARTPSLALSGDPSERLVVFRLSFPDQSEWLVHVASHFQVDCVGGLLASLGAQEPELLSARLCLWMAGPAGLGGAGKVGCGPCSEAAPPRQGDSLDHTNFEARHVGLWRTVLLDYQAKRGLVPLAEVLWSIGKDAVMAAAGAAAARTLAPAKPDADG